MPYMQKTTIYLSGTNKRDLREIQNYYGMSASQVIRHLIMMRAIEVRLEIHREIELGIKKRENENENTGINTTTTQ